MKRRLITGMLAALGLGTAMLSAEPLANAQEIQLTGPLKGAPAVRRMRQYREGRFEIAPTASFSLLDEYRRTILVGGRLTYNIKDWIGIGVWGAFGAISSTTDLTDQIQKEAPRDARTAANITRGQFEDQTAKISYVAAPQITFVPFRGKLAIFQKIFVDTDFYVSPGVAFVGLQERAFCGDKGQKACSDASTFSLDSRTAIAPTFAVGLTFYTSDFISLGVEYRALPFSWNRAGFDQRGGGNNNKFPDNKVNDQDQTFKWNQMITIAIGISLPTKPHISD